MSVSTLIEPFKLDWSKVISAAEVRPASPFPLVPNVVYRLRDGNFGCWQAGQKPESGNVMFYQYDTLEKAMKARGQRDGAYDYENYRIADGVCQSGKRDEESVVEIADGTKRRPKQEVVAEGSTDLYAALLKMNAEASKAAAMEALLAHRDGMNNDVAATVLKGLESPLNDYIGRQIATIANQMLGTKELHVRTADKVNVVHSPHPQLAETIEISRAVNNVWLCGPAGSGKTTLAHQLADSLGIPYSFISCTSGMSESKLLGRMNVAGTYLPAEFVRIYEEGGVFLWDEFDAADPNVVLCANAAMANGHLSVSDRVGNPVAMRHKDTILIVATNTWGRGATSEYSARESLDAATRDRFVLSKVHVGYAQSIEWQFLGAYTPVVATAWNAPKWNDNLQTVWVKVRANIEKHHLKRIMSTRAFVQAAALRAIGWNDQRIIERYFLDWSEPERIKALEGVC